MTENDNDRNEERPVVLYTSPDGNVTARSLLKNEALGVKGSYTSVCVFTVYA